MTNETIDKYLDQQGITSGEWEARVGLNYYIRSTEKRGNGYIGNYDKEEDARISANSRKSLCDWIMTAHRLSLFSMGEQGTVIYSIYTTATENIESSLDKPWEQVRAELEGFIDE